MSLKEKIDHYWKVNDGMSGQNGALTEIRYLRLDKEKLGELLALFKTLELNDFLDEPAALGSIYNILPWVVGNGLNKNQNPETKNWLRNFESELKSEFSRIFGQPDC